MDAWLAAYQDPMFSRFAVLTNVISMAAFVVFAVPMSLLAARDPAWARRYRLQSRRPRAQDLVWPSLRAFLINGAWLALFTGVSWPLLRHFGIHDGPVPPAWVVLLQVVFFIYLDDFLYYGLHRLMHQGWLWKNVHSVHHRIHIVTVRMDSVGWVVSGTKHLVTPGGGHRYPRGRVFVLPRGAQWEVVNDPAPQGRYVARLLCFAPELVEQFHRQFGQFAAVPPVQGCAGLAADATFEDSFTRAVAALLLPRSPVIVRALVVFLRWLSHRSSPIWSIRPACKRPT